MSKKLTQTQIRAIIEKLRKDINLTDRAIAASGPTCEERLAENQKYGIQLIKATDLPASVKKELITATNYHNCPHWIYDMDEKGRRSAGFPYPNPREGDEAILAANSTLEDMLVDLKFELTMVGQEDYKQAMADFHVKVQKVLG